MLLIVLMGIAGLLIDIGMARLTQMQMRSTSDAAAIEGAWQMAIGADDELVRQRVAQTVDEMAPTWGAQRIELEGGFDLDGDGVPESSTLINRDTLGQAVRTTLDLNLDNQTPGDIVIGRYDPDQVPETLPGQPAGYDRGDAFAPDDADNANDADSILVRLRRTGEADIPGGTSAERLSYLWSRGSLFNFRLLGSGIAVRSESIARLVPAVKINDAIENVSPSVLEAAILVEEIANENLTRSTLLTSNQANQIGDVVANTPADSVTGIGYLPVVGDVFGNGTLHVIGFMFAEVTEDAVIPAVPADKGFTVTGLSSNLAAIDVENLSNEVILANQALESSLVARAPVLVRSQQIQPVSP